ncbi:hypothetical protein GUITHDRAFT_133359 [Guillardia theta CCMP2712]|uniref:Rieske domain-containing protein n=1 Tax=Guillardia theta (strain CCMP2712) TaxID=905079 RepID=L1JWK5_GUITC|nr:hypothetical protein GUITHDRAFT_133359 [Guillardia theta CCMP2712]EKX52956.1 hypothetical protein GUITHDRAFT_133359 [Guillardia theta CCMP2712]|eukprot:XP_005839936.1 hypothetical protein GUITHDRAFT_133359 [Guillardia theta CCMP2712]
MVWHRVGNVPPENGRLHAEVEGRKISVISHRSKLYCLDSLCFHGGGPLGMGPIEDIEGISCLNCPWHNYKVTIEKGEKLYQSTTLDPVTKKLNPAGWKSVGQRQRTHRVEARADGVYVMLDLKGAIESDSLSFG